MANYAMELYHHGRLGQKWGKKNGPPYPLDYSKLSAEEIKQDKKRAIDEGDISTANHNRNYFTYQEINDVINRFNLNQKLSDLNQQQIQSGMDKAKKLADTLGSVANVLEKAGKVAQGIETITSNVSKINKTLNGNNSNNNNSNNNKDKKSDGKQYQEFTKKVYENGKYVKKVSHKVNLFGTQVEKTWDVKKQEAEKEAKKENKQQKSAEKESKKEAKKENKQQKSAERKAKREERKRNQLADEMIDYIDRVNEKQRYNKVEKVSGDVVDYNGNPVNYELVPYKRRW